jgi:hypothetical protein
MKNIGTTREGNHIVEMTHAEYKEFALLATANDGKPEYIHFDIGPRAVDYDYAGVFGAIRAFRDARFRVTELQDIVNALRSTLEIQE